MKQNYNENNIREAAYYNWQNAGCPNGQDEYFWTMALNQLYGSSCCCSNNCASSTKSASKSCATKSSTKKSSCKK